MDDVDNIIITDFHTWLSSGDFPFAHWLPDPDDTILDLDEGSGYERLVKLALFGHRAQSPHLEHAVAKEMFKCGVVDNCKYYVLEGFPALTTMVYEGTPKGHLLRRLMAFAAAIYVHELQSLGKSAMVIFHGMKEHKEFPSDLFIAKDILVSTKTLNSLEMELAADLYTFDKFETKFLKNKKWNSK